MLSNAGGGLQETSYTVGFDIPANYRELDEFYQTSAFEDNNTEETAAAININESINAHLHQDDFDFYTLDIHPEDHDYKENSQPAIVYSVMIDLKEKNKTVKMRPIGHSHIAGSDGLIYRDMENITTALSIVREVQVTVK